MSKQEISSIIITFIMGVFAGGYLYIFGFSITFKLPEVTTDNVYSEFVVVGENYGVCDLDNSCLSFQVLENGRYRAILENGTNDEIVKEGKIPGSVRDDLLENLTAGNLSFQSLVLANTDCQFGPETNNYRFQISLNLVNYSLDTCQNQIDYQSNAWLSLTDLWGYFTRVNFR